MPYGDNNIFTSFEGAQPSSSFDDLFPAGDDYFSAPQWPTQLYDINGNPTTMLPPGVPVPAGSFTSLGDAYAARYQAAPNVGDAALGSGAWNIPSNNAPGVIGQDRPEVTVPVDNSLANTPVNHGKITGGGSGVNIPGVGPTGTVGGGGDGLFGTNIDIGIPGLITLGGLGAAATGVFGNSGGQSSTTLGQNQGVTIPPVILGGGGDGRTTVPPLIPTGSNPGPYPTVTAGGGTPLGNGGSNGGDIPAKVVPPIIPIGGSGGGGTPGPTIPTTPTTPTTPTVPTATNILDRNYLREGTSTNADNAALGQGIFGNYAQFSGQYGAQDQANFASLLQQLGLSNNNLTGIANQQTSAANTALRSGNAADAANLGPGQLATLQALNPNQYSALNAANTSAQGGIAANQYQAGLGGQFAQGGSNPLLQFANNQAMGAGNGALGDDLQTMARQQLALGSGLSDEQKRNATQAAREGWAARGLINSTGAVAGEILNRDAYGQQLLNQRQGFAQNVNQLGQSQQGINNSFLLGTQGANQSATNANQNLGLNLASLDYGRQQQGYQNLFNNAQLQSANAFNPFATMNQNTTNTGSNSTLFGQNAGFSSGALSNQAVQSQVSPWNPYAADVFGSNFNAQNARSIAAGNNQAAMAGAQDAASGALANNFLNLLGQLYG